MAALHDSGSLKVGTCEPKREGRGSEGRQLNPCTWALNGRAVQRYNTYVQADSVIAVCGRCPSPSHQHSFRPPKGHGKTGRVVMEPAVGTSCGVGRPRLSPHIEGNIQHCPSRVFQLPIPCTKVRPKYV